MKLSEVIQQRADIICENLEQRSRVIEVLERAGMVKVMPFTSDEELVVFVFDGHYDTYQHPQGKTTTATDFLNDNL